MNGHDKKLKKIIKRKKRKRFRKEYNKIKLRRFEQLIMKTVSKICVKTNCCVFCGDTHNIEHFYKLNVFRLDFYICYDCYQEIK